MIKAIETIYNGYRFRSRLEARWAVFFDVLGIKYEYEPEGYQLENGECYLPDFWLPEFQVFVEVKHTHGNSAKAEELAKGLKKPVWFAEGPPEFKYYRFFDVIERRYDDHLKLIDPPVEEFISFAQILCKKRQWGVCLWADGDDAVGTSPGELYGSPDYHDGYDEEIKTAVLLAKQARFEHGQSPAVASCGYNKRMMSDKNRKDNQPF